MTGRELMRAFLAAGFPIDATVYVVGGGVRARPAVRVEIFTDKDGSDPCVVIFP
jgi:hypothetical protein